MAGEDEFPVPEDAEASSNERGDGVRCDQPGCDYVATGDMAAAKLGLHKRRKHGITGKTSGRGGKRRSTVPSTRAPREPSKARALREVEEGLAGTLGFLGGLIQGPMPLPGGYLVNTAEQGAQVITKVAARNEKVLGWLTGAGVATDYVALGVWAGGLLVAVAVQAGRIDFDHPMAVSSGVSELAVATYGLEALERHKAERHAERLAEQPVQEEGPEGGGEGGWAGARPDDDLGNGPASPAHLVEPSPV